MAILCFVILSCFVLLHYATAFLPKLTMIQGRMRPNIVFCTDCAAPSDSENSILFHVSDEDEDDGMDINLISETVLDQSIERAVKQMLAMPEKEPELSPVEKFNAMYKNLKSSKNDSSAPKLDSADMLAQLFTDKPGGDPFDERKVMMKLRQMLQAEDFEGLFKDPIVGEIY